MRKSIAGSKVAGPGVAIKASTGFYGREEMEKEDKRGIVVSMRRWKRGSDPSIKMKVNGKVGGKGYDQCGAVVHKGCLGWITSSCQPLVTDRDYQTPGGGMGSK